MKFKLERVIIKEASRLKYLRFNWSNQIRQTLQNVNRFTLRSRKTDRM